MKDMQALDQGVAVRFLYSLAAANGKMRNPAFFEVIDSYVTAQVASDRLETHLLGRLVDLSKFCP